MLNVFLQRCAVAACLLINTTGIVAAADEALLGDSPFNLHKEVVRAADKYGLRPEWIAAIVLTESYARPCAVSPVGAAGLMQLMPKTASAVGVVDAFDPAENLDGGSQYFRTLMDRFKGDFWQAAAFYNYGSRSTKRPVNRWPDETVHYVGKRLSGFLKKMKNKGWKKMLPASIRHTNAQACK